MQRLPMEVLAMTFKEATCYTTPGDHYVSLIRLMLVCRRWHSTVIGNTTLWSNITVSGGESVSHALRSLIRSGESHLAVDLTLSNLVPTDGAQTLLEHLADRSHRLASFKLVACSFPPLPRWASPATNLHTLTLRNRGNPQPLDNFIDGPLPQLRFLVLNGFSSWPAGQFRDLHHITLQIPPNHGAVSSVALLDLLSSSPGLRKFSVSGCVLPSPLSKVINLPYLTLLIMHTSSVRNILCHMSLPDAVEVRLISCTNTIGDLVEGPSPLLSPLSTLKVTLNIRQSTVTSRAFVRGKSYPSLVITEKLHSSFETAVAKVLEDYAIVPIFTSVEELILKSDCFFQIPWGIWFPNFPALRRLTICASNPNAFCTAVYEEFGFRPRFDPAPEFPSPHKIHIDWRAMSDLFRYYSIFRDIFISSTPAQGKVGRMVSRMKPRRLGIPGKGSG